MPRSCDTPGAQRPPLSAPRPSEEGAYTGRPHDLPGCRLVAGPASLPVRRLTLCKHGGAFVERAGPTSGESIQLDFRVDDVNDALKSLFVLDRRGGQVLGIRYDTRTDRTARVAESPLTLSDERALLDLLRALRGSEVRLIVGSGTAREEVLGQLVGVEHPDDAPLHEALVTLWRSADSAVAIYRLSGVRDVVVRDPRAARPAPPGVGTLR